MPRIGILSDTHGRTFLAQTAHTPAAGVTAAKWQTLKARR